LALQNWIAFDVIISTTSALLLSEAHDPQTVPNL